jgi:hypothetical protein
VTFLNCHILKGLVIGDFAKIGILKVNAYPDPALKMNAHPDPALKMNANQDPDNTLKKIYQRQIKC